MTSQWQSFREPLQATLLRNGIIAIAIGFVLARLGAGLARWPIASLLELWPSLGGHWLEVWFLNWLRPGFRPPASCRLRLVLWCGSSVVPHSQLAWL
jgi:energy-coupling factor transporter transmembrane protein EcfT